MRGLAPKIDFAVAMSPTEDTTSAMGQWLPKCCIYPTWRPDVIQTVLAKQQKQWKRAEGGKQVAIIVRLRLQLLLQRREPQADLPS